VSDAVTAVRWLLEQAEPEARRLAAQQLVKVPGDQVCELLRVALGDEDWRVRKEAAVSAAAIEERERVVHCLIGAIDDKENVGLRNAAVEALVNIGAAAVPATVGALRGLDADGRKLAVEILGGIPDERGVAALTQALVDEDANVRSAAAEALGSADRAGDDARALAVKALTGVLSSHEVFLKLAALDAIGRLDAYLPWAIFEPFVKDSVLRRYAIAAAARSDDAGALDALAGALTDPSRTVVREAVIAIGERLMGQFPETFRGGMERRVRGTSEARDRVRPMAKQLDDGRLRPAAFLVLGLFADTADIPLFVEALSDDDLMQHAEKALSCYGVEAVGPLLAVARGEPPQVRASVLSIVPTLNPGAMDEASPELEETLHDALQDDSPEVIAAALRLLAITGRADDLGRVAAFTRHSDPRVSLSAEATLALLAARHKDGARERFSGITASSPDAGVLCVVLGALARAGDVREEDLASLDLALAHGDARTRRAAIEALAAIGGDAASDAVAFALADEERDVRLAAVRALGTLGRTDVLIAMVERDHDPAVVAAALRALTPGDAEATYRAARPLLASRDASIASAAAEAIGRLPSPAHREALFDALLHPEAEVVKVALSEMGAQLDGLALSHLARCLDHASWEVRRLACELLGGHNKDGVHALLHARLDREREPAVREAIASALSARTPPRTDGRSRAPGRQAGR